MRLPVSWLVEYVDLPAGLTDPVAAAGELAAGLVRVGVKVERVDRVGEDVTGVVVGEVLDVADLTGFRKPIRFCQVRVATDGPPRGIVCGAANFAVGDRVPVALPGATLPGGVRIAARQAYGRVSDGMICSAAELGAGDDHSGILVLPGDPPLGADVAELLALRDAVLELDVSADRGYALSVRGVARELAGAVGGRFTDPADGDPPPQPIDADPYPAAIDDPTAADRLVLRAVDGLDPTAGTPHWMSRRLRLAGVRPISLAVDVTNYVMFELGQPLHAFDRTRLKGPVRVRRGRSGERLTTLDHVTRELDPADVVIADDSGPLSLAGTMGGQDSEVGPQTRDLVIEAAHFAPAGVLRMSRRHRLASEASSRFERGVDPALPPVAAARAAALLVRLGGARDRGATEVDLPRPARTITVDPDLPGRVVGVGYSVQTVRARLAEVGCAVSGDRPLQVRPPGWRPDLADPYDLVEEVARLEGYERIPSLLPRALPGRGLTAGQRRRRAVARALAAAGYVEVLSVPFHGRPDLAALGVPDDDPRWRLLRLANPLSERADAFRSSLLVPLLETARRNLRRGAADLALYELGSVARDRGGPPAPRPPVDRRPDRDEQAALDAALPDQPLHLAVVLAGQREAAGWWGPGRPAGWGDAVEAARTAARAAGGQLQVQAGRCAPWHPGRCAELLLAGRAVGHAGELHPRVTAALELPERTAALELDLSSLLAAPVEAAAAPIVSPFPPATQDVALVVPRDVPAAAVAEALASGGGDLVEDVVLFDVFTGPQLGDGRKSLAYTLRFRAPDRTLTGAEVAAARDRAVAAAAERTGAQLRG